MRYDNGWPRYVPVAKRRAKAEKELNALRKAGKEIQPVKIAGRKIANTFWGKAWCEHLGKFSDYENRLPRGRSYVRNGSVCHLEIARGQVSAMVSGSRMYKVSIDFKPLAKKRWSDIQKACSGQVGSLLELLQGKLSDNVMQTVTHQQTGLFPQPREITIQCSCPDWAHVCKHVAAVMYGVGARLDESPELLFLLRGVDHRQLVAEELKIPQSNRNKPQVSGDLADIFGIELETSPAKPARRVKKTGAKKTSRNGYAPSIGKESTRTEDYINISRGIRASHVLKLRKQFSMTPAEFSLLTGISFQSLKKWESSKGLLKLHQSSQLALEKAFALNKTQAWSALEKIVNR